MINKSTGLKVFILPLSLGIVALFAVLEIQPKFSEMQKNSATLADDQKQFVEIQKEAQKLSELKSTWQTLAEKRLVSVALPQDKAMDDFVAELYQRVAASGALITDISSKEAASPDLTKPYICSASSEPAAAAGTAQSQAASSYVPTTGVTSSVAGAPSHCVNAATVTISVKGNWDQTLNLMKYLAGTNRIANLSDISIAPANSSDPSAPASSDILESKFSSSVFFMAEQSNPDPKVAELLASGSGFNQSSIQRIKQTIFSEYQEPVVSASGERNLFK